MTASTGDIEPWARDPGGGKPIGDDPRRCHAHRSDGSGIRCERWAVAGLKVCPQHGGSGNHARSRGQLNLMEMVGKATAVHRRILDESEDERVLLKAVEMVYDRVGLDKFSTSVEAENIRNMIKARMLDRANGVTGDEVVIESDIVDGEVVEDVLKDLL